MAQCTLLPYQWDGQIQFLSSMTMFAIFYNLKSQLTPPYINDVPIKGPATRYLLPDGKCETLALNPGIMCFVWEHFQNINHILQHMKYSSGTFSRTKSMLCVENFVIIGYYCTPFG
jgi:hypothetical protein